MSRATERAIEHALARLDSPESPDGHVALGFELFNGLANNMGDAATQDRMAEAYLKAHDVRDRDRDEERER